jgi:hypothetical protein
MNLYHWETWEITVVADSAGKYCRVFFLPTKNVNYFYAHEGEN